MKTSAIEKVESKQVIIDLLNESCNRGKGEKPTIYTQVTHVSNSGMSRNIKFYVIINNKPRLLDYHIEKILEYTPDKKHEGVKVGGAGMDMGFHVVYTLSRALFKDTAKGDAGYLIQQEWL